MYYEGLGSKNLRILTIKSELFIYSFCSEAKRNVKQNQDVFWARKNEAVAEFWTVQNTSCSLSVRLAFKVWSIPIFKSIIDLKMDHIFNRKSDGKGIAKQAQWRLNNNGCNSIYIYNKNEDLLSGFRIRSFN